MTHTPTQSEALATWLQFCRSHSKSVHPAVWTALAGFLTRQQEERDQASEHRRRAEMQRDKARENYEEIAATCGLHPDTSLDALLGFIESVRAEARVSADVASAEYHAKRERDEAREHRRRLFEALETALKKGASWESRQEAADLLNELRPHVAKEQG